MKYPCGVSKYQQKEDRSKYENKNPMNILKKAEVKIMNLVSLSHLLFTFSQRQTFSIHSNKIITKNI